MNLVQKSSQGLKKQLDPKLGQVRHFFDELNIVSLIVETYHLIPNCSNLIVNLCLVTQSEHIINILYFYTSDSLARVWVQILPSVKAFATLIKQMNFLFKGNEILIQKEQVKNKVK